MIKLIRGIHILKQLWIEELQSILGSKCKIIYIIELNSMQKCKSFKNLQIANFCICSYKFWKSCNSCCACISISVCKIWSLYYCTQCFVFFQVSILYISIQMKHLYICMLHTLLGVWEHVFACQVLFIFWIVF